MQTGDVVRMRSVKAYHRDENGDFRAEFTYKPPKEQDFVVLILGTVPFAENEDPEAMLRDLGWKPEDEVQEYEQA